MRRFAIDASSHSTRSRRKTHRAEDTQEKLQNLILNKALSKLWRSNREGIMRGIRFLERYCVVKVRTNTV